MQKKMKFRDCKIQRNMKKQEKGITLIALVITIIVLLILATVSIATLTGENGILTRANDARTETGKATAKEKVEVEVLGSYGDDGNLDYGLLEDNLNNIEGIQGVPSPITDDSFSIKVIVDGYEITIEKNGNVTVENKIDNLPSATIGKTDGSFDTEKGVNTPKLSNNMELVIYDEETKEWIPDETNSAYSYADTSIAGNENKSEWANAKVTINGVESYFVWIPRYEYKIDNTTNTIDVKFIPTTQTTANEGYIIHPAFTTDKENGGWTEELSGLWIGKYEVSQSDAGTTVDEMGSSEVIQIKPNVTSWRSMTIGQMYEKAKEYLPELKSHMLKNSEWGAVAYLAHSKYGRNRTEIAINNSSDYITGSSGGNANASPDDAVYEYATPNGKLASTTGNIYGIYDLSGGAYEYVASYYSGSTSDILTNNGSQLVNEINREYVTAYDGTNVDTDYKLGDATKETKEWNNDYANFIISDRPFFKRGGIISSASKAGIFRFNNASGNKDATFGFRICLVT